MWGGGGLPEQEREERVGHENSTLYTCVKLSKSKFSQSKDIIQPFQDWEGWLRGKALAQALGSVPNTSLLPITSTEKTVRHILWKSVEWWLYSDSSIHHRFHYDSRLPGSPLLKRWWEQTKGNKSLKYWPNTDIIALDLLSGSSVRTCLDFKDLECHFPDGPK